MSFKAAPAKGAAAVLTFLYYRWHAVVLAVLVALVVLVFGQRGTVEAMIGAAIVGAAVVIAALQGSSL